MHEQKEKENCIVIYVKIYKEKTIKHSRTELQENSITITTITKKQL